MVQSEHMLKYFYGSIRETPAVPSLIRWNAGGFHNGHSETRICNRDAAQLYSQPYGDVIGTPFDLQIAMMNSIYIDSA